MSHIAPILASGADLAPAPESTNALDAHGRDPAAYDWVPVLKKRRKDGWSPICATARSALVSRLGERTDSGPADGADVELRWELR